MDRRLRLSNAATVPVGEQPYVASNQPMIPTPPVSTTRTMTEQPHSDKDATAVEKKDKDKNDDDNNDSDDDDDLDEYDDDDEALEAFRQRRLAELKSMHQTVATNQGKGHGEVRTISQDEFLPECTGSQFVVVHFFHDDFDRCKIMDHHLKIMAPLHLSCKFIRINAEKAPFFVTKLAIQTLPTLLVFQDGKTIDRLTGFTGLSNSKNPDQFSTSRLGQWLEQTGAIEYEGPESDDDNDNAKKGSSRITPSGTQSRWYKEYDEDV